MQRSTPETREQAENASPDLRPRDVALENVVMMTGLGRYDDVRQLLADLHPADIAELMDRLDEARVRQRVSGLLPSEAGSAVLSLVSPAARDHLVANLSDRELAGLVEELDTDDAADLLDTLPEERTPTVLAAFLPVIIATAGAVGLQSSTLVVRAIALDTLSLQRVLSVIVREAATGLALGASCGLIAAAASYLINMDSPDILKLSLAVLIGMVISVTAAACVGTVQPIVFYKLNRDPAVAAGPLVTAFNDVLGTTLYLLVATALQA